ncbi:MAG: thioredoxin-disulfide reductase [Alphaproteobacteria bacterium]|nr:thioredoxin-disulfide reductase [Pseudomonadota bacterium]TDI64838.1 MAG: thioredoxin-disulfide reductase [Alphaproteobacteria bacterium]
MTDNIHAKVLILGSGPAGLTAGIYAARANLNPLMVSGLQPGGQMTITTDVENYPGFAETIQGPWLMEEMQNQARKVGTTFVSDLIVSVDFSSRPFLCTGDTGTVYSGDTVIVSTGATARWLGLDSEEKFKGFGVSACATCDGFFYRGKKVCVIGGGNTAVEEAIYLTNHAEAVTLIHRRDELRAEMILQDRLMANPKITVIWDSVLQEVIGDDKPLGVTGARIANVKTSEQTVLEFDGVFIAIGHNPNTEIFAGILDMDDEGYLITQADVTATNIPGVFAAGDVQDKIFRQAVTAAGTGCMAAIEAEKFLAAATSADRRSAAE